MSVFLVSQGPMEDNYSEASSHVILADSTGVEKPF